MKEWTKEEKKKILNDYWTSDSAYCPTDNTPLKIIKMQIQQVNKDLLEIRCPRCGKKFRSSEIEPLS